MSAYRERVLAMKEIKKELNAMQDLLRDRENNQLSQINYALTEILRLVDEEKEIFAKYEKEKNNLLSDLKAKEAEVTKLQHNMLTLNNRQKNKMFHLYERLHFRSEKLVTLQNNYFSIKKDIENSRQKIKHLEEKKGKIASERNWLKIEYDHLKGALKENKIVIDKLEHKQKLVEDIEQESLQRQVKEKEISFLMNKQSLLQHQINEIHPTLMKKMKDVTSITNEIQLLKKHIHEKQAELKQLEVKITEQNEKIMNHKRQYETVVKEFEKGKHIIKAYTAKISQEKNTLTSLVTRLLEIDRQYKTSIAENDIATTELKEQLLTILKELTTLEEKQEEPELFLIDDLKDLYRNNKF